MQNSTAVFPMLKSPRSDGALYAAERLTGCVQRVAALTPMERDRLYALLAQYFINVTQAQFERDLAEKEWIILLMDAASGEIQGFSTLMQLRTVADHEPVVAFFSGRWPRRSRTPACTGS
jgi:hypothetical protein